LLMKSVYFYKKTFYRQLTLYGTPEHFHSPVLAQLVLLEVFGSQVSFVAALVRAFEMSFVFVSSLMST
jgi:hypothetical protein